MGTVSNSYFLMNIIACTNFKPELEAIFKEDDVVLSYFKSCNCRAKQHELFKTDEITPENTLILGGLCLRKLALTEKYKEYDFVLSENCFYQLLNKPMIDKFQQDGYYLVSKGWLLDWRKNIAEMGFTQNEAIEFWAAFPKDILFLNTDEKDMCKEINNFCQFIDKDFSVIDLGLYNYESTVKKEYFKKYSQIQEEKLKQEVQKSRKEVSDYQLSYEVFKEIIDLESTEEVVEEILRLIQILVGAKNVSFIPVEFKFKHKVLSINSDDNNNESSIDIEGFAASSKTWMFLEDKHQLLLRLMYKELSIGIILIENIKFPEFSDSYKDILLRLNTFFSILIINRKSFDEIEEKERLLIDKNNQLKKSYEEVSESIKFKEFLIAKTSHEIRNPLSGIIGLTSQIQEEIESQKIKTMTSLIEDAGNRILMVVDDLLNFSKISNKSINLSFNSFKAADLIDSLIQAQISLIKQKGVEVRKDIQPVELICFSDEHRIQQIIENLLINALKYSEGSLIEIIVKETDVLKITVKDNGKGIKPEQEKHIFEPFYRANDTEQGSGLGLTIIKEIVDVLDGEIILENKIGVGCSFAVLLPILDRGENYG